MINEEEEFWKQLPDSDDTIVEPVLDAHSGAVLDVDKVRAARQEELAYTNRVSISKFHSQKPNSLENRSSP